MNFMKYYYAMITPGRASDWGDVILINYAVGKFVEKVAGYFEEEDLEKLKEEFSEPVWEFLKKEFEAENMSDIEFVKSVSNSYDSLMSDNYYSFSKLNSTLEFGSVTAVVDYAKENEIELVGDLT